MFLGCASVTVANEVSSEKANQSYLAVENNCREILVSVDHLILDQEGLFVDLGCEGIISVRSMTLVEPGMYSVRFIDEGCPRHGIYCPACRGCHPNNYCSGRCKCPPRW